MGITIGSARIDENGNTVNGKAGDQTGNEVATQSLYFTKGNWTIFRANDKTHQRLLASKMLTACNNDNIGYDQNNRTAIYSTGTSSSVPTECDCSSLVTQCVREATGANMANSTTSSLAKNIMATGIFTRIGTLAANSTVLACTGDVILRSGHVAIVVDSENSPDITANAEATTASTSVSASDSLTSFNGYFKARKSVFDSNVVTKTYIKYGEEEDSDTTSTRSSKSSKKSAKTKKRIILATYEVIASGDPWFSKDYWSKVGLVNNAINYAWARFSEESDPYLMEGSSSLLEEYGGYVPADYALHSDYAAKIPICNPGDLYIRNEDGYTRNTAPCIGSIICFYLKGSKNGNGHVAVVEEINTDGEGSLVCSEVWRGSFRIKTYTKRYGSWNWFDGTAEYVFQGFIHNSTWGAYAMDESALATFCRIAEEKVGESTSWALSEAGTSGSSSTSAATVVAIAKTAGSILNIIIPNTTSCTAIGRIGVLRNMGEFLEGPAQGSYASPEIGDIVLFKYSSKSTDTIYTAEHCGIVTVIAGTAIKVVEARGSAIQQTDYNIRSNNITGYFRPNWDQIDGTTDSVKLYRNLQGLYNEGVTVNDACARELCYINSNYKPSISPSKIHLSAINYTGLLSDFYSVFGSTSLSDSTDAELIVDLNNNTLPSYYQEEGYLVGGIDGLSGVYSGTASASVTDELSSNYGDYSNISVASISPTQAAKTCLQFFLNEGLSMASACGIIGNIHHESSFNTAAVGDYGTSFGICQWHNNRGSAMKKYCGSTWESNLTGQLNYLMTELRGSSSYYGFDKICAVSNNLSGAKKAADIFCRKFERPADVDNTSKQRQSTAAGYWTKFSV